MPIILLSALSLGILAALFGLGLGYAGVKFEVTGGEAAEEILKLLPNANCGGCGFAGCAALAAAIYEKKAAPSACPATSEANIKAISEIINEETDLPEKKSAFIKCAGSLSNCKTNYNYKGLNDCRAAKNFPNGGARSCAYACVGLANCARVCKFGAINIKNGVAVVDSLKCKSCGVCAKVCPKNLIHLSPNGAVNIACSSRDNGKVVTNNCNAGCIACALCAKACKQNAIEVKNFLAEIHYARCNNCGECRKVCPKKIIV